MPKVFSLVCAALFFLMLVGNGAAIEIDDQVFIPTMGVDRVEGGLQLTVHMPRGAATGESGDPASEYTVVMAQARGFSTCLDVLRIGLPRKVNYMQLMLIVFSEEVARDEGFFALIEEMINSQQIGPHATVSVSQCKASEIIENLQPQVGMSLTRSLEGALKSLESTTYADRQQLMMLYHEMVGETRDATTILSDIQQPVHLGELIAKERQPGDILPGQLPVEHQYRVVRMGAALINDQRMVDTLTGYEVQLMGMLKGDVTDSLIFLSPEGMPTLTTYVRQSAPSKVVIDMAKGSIQVELFLSFYTLLDRSMTPEEHAGYAACAEAMMHEHLSQLIDKLQHSGVDPVGFAGYAVRGFPTVQRWQEYQWKERWPGMAVDIIVSAHMRDPGDGPGSQPYTAH